LDTTAQTHTFKTLEEFLVPWKHHNYEDSSSLLYNVLDETEKRIKKDEKIFAIETINLFREGILPAWEDPKNQYGYDLKTDIDVSVDQRELTEKKYKDLWRNLVLGLIGEEFEYSQWINGI